ncbi:MAG: NAD(P)/FAD-dependent oxidoreductase [Proteobacteria bacterium]|nr:NAD(P)/FAD-dependent oxidoreductase [Pseudomonadota bacterium]
MSKKKVVIIGSGIGGSGVGALLAHSGAYEVSLYERNKLIGGRFASYEKEGFKIDIGCHLIANCDKGALGQILRLVGRPDWVEWHYALKPEPCINFKGKRVRFPEEIDAIGLPPEDVSKLMEFYTRVLSIPEAEYDAWDRRSVFSLMQEYTKNETVRAVFGLLSAIFFVISDQDTPVGEYALCSKQMLMNQSTGYPAGGTGSVPEAYVRSIKTDGGQVFLSTPIKQVVVENGEAKGIILETGQKIEADIVISNAGNQPTVNFLVGRKHYRPEVLERLDKYQYSYCTSMMKIALDQPITDELMVMFIGRDDLSVWEKENQAGIIPEVLPGVMAPVISNLDPKACPAGRQLIIAGGGMHPMPEKPDNKFFKKLEASMYNALKIIYPGIEKHIMWTIFTTSREIDNLFGEDGNVVGIAQKIGQVGPDRPFLTDPCVKNLYHCSADSGRHGIGGELAADSALRLFELLESK